jgi:hypothetical protein
MRGLLDDESIALKFSNADKTTIDEETNEALAFLEASAAFDIEDLGEKEKEMQRKFNPIMRRLYGK